MYVSVESKVSEQIKEALKKVIIETFNDLEMLMVHNPASAEIKLVLKPKEA